MPRIVPRDFGTSLLFNGSTSKVTSTWQNFGAPMTFTGWAKRLSTSGTQALFSGSAGNSPMLRFNNGNMGIAFWPDSGNPNTTYAESATKAAGATLNSWFQYALTYDNVNAVLYINGVLISSNPITTILNNTGTYQVGARGTSSDPFNGFLDAPVIYNRVLSQQEILNTYQAGIRPTDNSIKLSWKFNEGSGTTAADDSGNSFNGTILNASYSVDVAFKLRQSDTTRIAPRTGRAALVYRGGQQAVVSGVTSQMNSAYTMSIWARRGKIDNNAQAMIRDTVGDKMWFNFDGSGSNSIRVYHQDLSPANTNTALRIADNAWHHYVATYNGSQINIYVDGVLRATNNVTGTLSMSGQFNVGGVTNFSGMIRAVHVYNRALTLAEIRQAYFGNLYPTTNRILVWPTNEGTGLTLYDSSGNGNNGTMSADLTWTIDTPIGQRALISPNLVNNGDFSYIPPVNVPQTGTGYVDGSTGGSTTQQFGGWYVTGSGSGKSAQFDSTTQYNGLNSFKLSTTATGSYIESRSNGANDYFPPGKGFRLQPSTTYTLSYAIKTNVTSGTSNDGAYVDICLYNYNGGSASEVATTKVKVTQDWTTYTMNFTTSAVQTLGHVEPRIYGHTGSANLIMDAWFANIQVTPQTPISRQIIT